MKRQTMTQICYRTLLGFAALQTSIINLIVDAHNVRQHSFHNTYENKASRILDTQCTGNTAGTYPCDDIDLEAFIASSTFTESSSKRLSE